ncbi:hypothetical protein T07_639 [Trichinella nelsoni]|uniref:Uncharacterized protein n=1 Tax=Trichinella nelsoni TaxID=6336 RepID=A0A0V0RX38_9BILA|nr:hypothetical protein T07_639 [Trichinella nelsoni]
MRATTNAVTWLLFKFVTVQYDVMEIENYQEIGHLILIKNLPNNVPYFSPIYLQYTSCAECREIRIICKNAFFIFTVLNCILQLAEPIFRYDFQIISKKINAKLFKLFLVENFGIME